MKALHDVVAAIVSAADYDQAAQALIVAAELVQADGAVFCTFNASDEDYESYRYLVHGVAAFCSMYERSLGFLHDPFLIYAAFNTEPIHLSKLRPSNEDQRRLLALAAEHGFRDAYAVPVQSAGSRRSCLYFGHAKNDFFAKTDQAVLRMTSRVLAAEMHDWWLRRTAREFADRFRLDEAEVSLLRFERQGLSSKDIAQHLGSTAAAVNSKFQRLTQRLGVGSRRDAARQAEDAGLFFGLP